QRLPFLIASTLIYVCSLFFNDICSLWSTITFYDLECNVLPFFQCFKSFLLNGGVMDENVISFFQLHKSVPFFRIEPFYDSILHSTRLLTAYTFDSAFTSVVSMVMHRDHGPIKKRNFHRRWDH